MHRLMDQKYIISFKRSPPFFEQCCKYKKFEYTVYIGYTLQLFPPFSSLFKNLSSTRETVGLVDQSNIKNQPFYFIRVFSCWLHCHSMEVFFFQVAVEGRLRPFSKNATGFTSLLFSSASLGRKTSFSTCRRINFIY